MRSLKLSAVPIVLGVLAVVALPGGSVLGQSDVEQSLYDRLGGYGAISAVVNDFAEKLFIDPQVGAFFKGMGTDTRQSFIQKNINLVCNVTGGPCKVLSRPAKTCIAPGFLDSDLKVIISTQPRPGRRSRVALEPGCDSRTSPASTARCTSA